jgi:Kdo2-lipid IVA lauroyltransferase/acyltransferase
MLKRLQEFGALAGIALGRLLCRLPLSVQRSLARAAGSAAYRLARRRRRIAETNLKICFPEWTPGQRAAVTRKFFQQFSAALMDLFWLWHRPKEAILQRVSMQGLEHLEQAEKQSAGALIILAPHFLGIDAGGTRLQIDRALVCLYSNQSVPAIDRWVIQGRSRFQQATLVSRREGIGRLARLLRSGTTAHFSPDMDFGRDGAVFVPFFGEPAATPTSLVRLARMANATVVPMVTRITPEGYEARFYPGWRYSESDDLQASVAALNQKIEGWIREDPSQYLWTHRRFKTRPPGAPSVYS